VTWVKTATVWRFEKADPLLLLSCPLYTSIEHPNKVFEAQMHDNLVSRDRPVEMEAESWGMVCSVSIYHFK
jgi:hypothetical protein